MIIAIVPARKGSRGAFHKNFRNLAGIPLACHSLESALSCRHVDRAALTSDDEELLDFVRTKYPSVICIERPKSLANSSAMLSDVIHHAATYLTNNGFYFDAICELYPTSPFRTSALMDFLIGKLLAGHSSVVSYRRAYYGNMFYLPLASQPVQVALQSPKKNQHSPLYRPSGLFVGWNLKSTLPPYMYIMQDGPELVDIDHEDDFEFAAFLMEKGYFKR